MSHNICRLNMCSCCDEPFTFVDRTSCISHLDHGCVKFYCWKRSHMAFDSK
uniref:Predicted protein n=1 Tax=Hordeum vulgare subsp. vulgare TaxID=112509 RepID=F2EJJ0_HORVV|nr:predicted protein [Hordeum vulgare subsp. vulgare]